MLTRSDLSALLAADPPLGVSIFLPTHVLGSETRQDPIRLKNLVSRARTELTSGALTSAEADDFLAPAVALTDDHDFWQHQDHGLALFLDGGEPRHYTVPLSLPEEVVVGPGFHLRPLLPLFTAAGRFLVLTITASRVRLFDATRFAISERIRPDLPQSVEDVPGESDYENPVQASPVARPHTGAMNIGNAQVYGDSPAEWRKGRLVDFTARVAAAMKQLLAEDSVPFVLAADAETGGHLQKAGNFGPLLAGVIEVNPETMDDGQLHAAAYPVVQPRLDEQRAVAVERFETLHGRTDPRAVTDVGELVRAAVLGRVDTLLLVGDLTVWGRYDEGAKVIAVTDGRGVGARDLLDVTARATLHHGGVVHHVPTDVLSVAAPAAAIMRY